MGICISNDGNGKCIEALTIWSDLNKCLSGLSISGKYILTSCNTGAPKDGKWDNNIASAILQATGKPVIAPQDTTNARTTKIVSIKPFEIFEKSKKGPEQNNYREFK